MDNSLKTNNDPNLTNTGINLDSELITHPEGDLLVQTPLVQPTTLNQTTDSVAPKVVVSSPTTSFDPPQNWGTSSTSTTTTTSQNNLPYNNQPSKSSGVFKGILISLALILVGVLVGVLAAKFFQPTQNTNQDLMTEESVEDPSMTAETAEITPEVDLKEDWKKHTDIKNSFEFIFPPKLVLTKTDNKMEANTLNISIVNRALEAEVKRNELTLDALKTIAIPESDKVFMKGSIEANSNVLIGFLSLTTKQTLVLTQYLDGSVSDEMINKEFEEILSSFKFVISTPSAQPATDSAAFNTPAS